MQFITRLVIYLCQRFLPNFGQTMRIMNMSDMFGVVYGGPLAIIALIWLGFETDLQVIRDEWALVLIVLVLNVIADRLSFTVLFSTSFGRGTSNVSGSLTAIINWSVVFVVGATGLWLIPISSLIEIIRTGKSRWQNATQRLNILRNYLLSVLSVAFGLFAIGIYRQLDGPLPLADFSNQTLIVAVITLCIGVVLADLSWMPYLVFGSYISAMELGSSPQKELRNGLNLWVFSIVFNFLIMPFPILAAGSYTQMGSRGFLLLMLGVLLANALIWMLSRFVERSQLRTLEMQHLEGLGRAIIDGPPDASTLPGLLNQHVPPMFTLSQIRILVFPDSILLDYDLAGNLPDHMWGWMQSVTEPGYQLPDKAWPWNPEETTSNAIAYAPIQNTDTGENIGAICLITGHPDRRSIREWLPAIQSLAAQIASALHSAEIYYQNLEHEKLAQELAIAGRIQNSFLPTTTPQAPGWQLVADLEPARDTSGDFYDFIPLSANRLGVLVADVADKGVGAALYMALSRTVIRTYAVQYPEQPAQALQAANKRILADTHTDLFVTVFYGVLDLTQGTLTYCNAGHNPGYLIALNKQAHVEDLARTGIPLGMFEDYTWEQRQISFDEGAVLLLYSDGLTEAHNAQAELFGDKRLLALVESHTDVPVETLQQRIIQSVHEFVGDTPQFDDITLMMVRRNSVISD